MILHWCMSILYGLRFNFTEEAPGKLHIAKGPCRPQNNTEIPTWWPPDKSWCSVRFQWWIMAPTTDANFLQFWWTPWVSCICCNFSLISGMCSANLYGHWTLNCVKLHEFGPRSAHARHEPGPTFWIMLGLQAPGYSHPHAPQHHAFKAADFAKYK